MKYSELIEFIFYFAFFVLVFRYKLIIDGHISSRIMRKQYRHLVKKYGLDCMLYGLCYFTYTTFSNVDMYLGANSEGLYFIPADTSAGIIKIRYENIEYYEKNVSPYHPGKINYVKDSIEIKFTYRYDDHLYTVKFENIYYTDGFNRYALRHGNLYTYIDQHIKRKTNDITI